MPVDAAKSAWGVAKWVGGALVGKLKNEGDLAEIEARVQAKVETEMIDRDRGANKIALADAKARGFLQSTWRPAIGWMAGLGVGYGAFLPVLNWLIDMVNAGFARPWPDLPAIDTTQLFAIITSMLGMAGLRTYEKKHKIDGGRLGRDEQ
ncbi:MAG: 3TM-type holin [Gemmatimonadetes bacterium]|nr:3TM-type holin [Gemmatimonadota bacterium]